MKRTDVGFDAHIGYPLTKSVSARVRCQLGTSSLLADAYGSSVSTFSFGFSICYTFQKRDVTNLVSETPQ